MLLDRHPDRGWPGRQLHIECVDVERELEQLGVQQLRVEQLRLEQLCVEQLERVLELVGLVELERRRRRRRR